MLLGVTTYKAMKQFIKTWVISDDGAASSGTGGEGYDVDKAIQAFKERHGRSPRGVEWLQFD